MFVMPKEIEPFLSAELNPLQPMDFFKNKPIGSCVIYKTVNSNVGTLESDLECYVTLIVKVAEKDTFSKSLKKNAFKILQNNNETYLYYSKTFETKNFDEVLNHFKAIYFPKNPSIALTPALTENKTTSTASGSKRKIDDQEALTPIPGNYDIKLIKEKLPKEILEEKRFFEDRTQTLPEFSKYTTIPVSQFSIENGKLILKDGSHINIDDFLKQHYNDSYVCYPSIKEDQLNLSFRFKTHEQSSKCIGLGVKLYFNKSGNLFYNHDSNFFNTLLALMKKAIEYTLQPRLTQQASTARSTSQVSWHKPNEESPININKKLKSVCCENGEKDKILDPGNKPNSTNSPRSL